MKFQEIKEKYKQAQVSHTETKHKYKNEQRSYSHAMNEAGDLEKKDLRYPYDSLSKLESSHYEIRVFHVAYSLLRGTAREKIEKVIDTFIDHLVEAKLDEMIKALGASLELVKDDNGSILKVKRGSHEE